MESLTARAALRRIASLDLPGADSGPFHVDSPDQLLLLADVQRMAVRLDHAVTARLVDHDGDESWVARCRDRAVAAAETTLAAHAAAMTVAPLLLEAGVEATILKGCASAHLDYERPIDRFSSDVDVLVSADDRDRALELLGGTTLDSVRSEAWNDRFAHASTIAGPTGVEVDVHTRLQHGYVGFSVPIAEFAAAGVDFSIGGTALRSVDGPSRLLLAALNASGVHRSLHSARDVPQLARVGGVDWAESVDRAERWRIDALFARGVLDAWSMFDLEPHPLTDWARRHHPRGRQRLTARWTGPRSQVLSAPLALPPSQWLAYTWPLLRPDRSYVDHTGKAWRQRWRIIMSELRRR